MTENHNLKKTMGDYIKQIGAYGILITFFAIGLAIAGAFWSSTVADLNNQLNQNRTELKNKTDELNQTKNDYLTYKVLNEDNKTIKTNNPTSSPIETIKKNGEKIETVTINTEKSHSFFGGELTISLVATPFEGSPLRHKVIANISSPSGSVVKISNKDIGTVISYNGKTKFKITILEAETFSATFQVTFQ